MPAIDSERWTRLGDIVTATTGLHFRPDRMEDLQRGVTAAARELGFEDTAACADWLLSASITPGQVRVLASHLTVGETYFFRERSAFDAFVDRIVRGIARDRGHSRRLRIWSAACCTGEEPYSLAMALHDALPDRPEWDISILATDINPRFLEKAIAGIYGEWSFRNDTSGIKGRFFQRTADGRHAVIPAIKKLVKFAPLNLMDDVYPSQANGTDAMDVIFCRNVLMYFGAGPVRKIIRKLHDALIPGGWLVVSPSEASHALFPQFVQVNRPGTILYRRRLAHAGEGHPIVSETELAGATSVAPTPEPDSDQRYSAGAAAAIQAKQGNAAGMEPVGMSPALADALPLTALSCAAQARACANLGDLKQALAWCDRAAAADRLDAGIHYLRAVILCEQGLDAEARVSLQKALFLEPELVLTHYTLGSIAWRAGDTCEARRHFTNAARLLDRCQADELIPDSGGLTAASLGDAIASMMNRETAG